MSSADELILRQLAGIPSQGRKLGVFVRMDGNLAVVNVGDRSVAVPCSGFYPPVVGMSVQLERNDGQLLLTGPAKQLSPLGKIKAGGSPKATVTVDGRDWVLGYRSGYTPVIGDDVEVNWATGIIQGKVTVAPVAAEQGENPGGGGAVFSNVVVMAEGSGSFNSRWWTNDVWNSDSNTGAWFYGNRVVDALKGSTVTGVDIFLNPRQSSGYAPQVGLHSSGSQPGVAVAVSGQVALEPRSGWVALPVGWGATLRDTVSGIGVTASGYTIWRGTQSDAMSGALRFSGRR